jgi:hypothetical protein
MAAQTTRDNQKVQNMANQRSQELKPEGRKRTGAGETSETESASSTNADGRVATDNRDVETFNASDRDSGARVGDNRDGRNH